MPTLLDLNYARHTTPGRRGGSGIGLVLSPRIAEAHGGALSLGPRPDPVERGLA